MTLSRFLKKMLIARQLTFKEGHFEMLGIRGVNLPVFTLTRFIEEMYESQEDAVFDMLFRAGVKHGKFGVEQIGQKNEMGKKEFFHRAIGSGNVMGLGKFEIQKLDLEEQVMIATVSNSPFVEAFEESNVLSDVDGPVDHLQRGILHGIAEETFETEISSTEETCAFHGDGDTCRFRFVAR